MCENRWCSTAASLLIDSRMWYNIGYLTACWDTGLCGVRRAVPLGLQGENDVVCTACALASPCLQTTCHKPQHLFSTPRHAVRISGALHVSDLQHCNARTE